ncbi:MAG: ATPase, T2SS/T4P/T4SS family [Candidatus Vogelbacteria bacterium]|nr:ATPase, T2SS/T4P/T4SS family [Candidatus Vogelbacteria bacterium]
MVTFDEDKQDKRVAELHLKEAEGLAQMLSTRYNLPYIDLTKVSLSTDALRLIAEDEAHLAAIAAFRLSGRNVDAAVLTPNNGKIADLVVDLNNKGFNVKLWLCSQNSLDRAWDRYAEIGRGLKADAGVIQISDEAIATYTAAFKTVEDVKKTLDEEIAKSLQVGGISTLLEVILSGALATSASDIHIEPEETAIRLRYRLDGVLHDICDIDNRLIRQITSRLKLVSGMKLNVQQAAQDGRFSIKVEGTEMEIRSSVIPGSYGESIVMRVLNPKSINVTFENLGVDDQLYKIFAREISRPNGMILLTGPTGSGKTTTLYSFLRKVNSSENKTITIEDPIEYHLEGINQTQVNRIKGYTFLSGLRAALRQDPDIIMVGEIRDSETAKIAVNASLTGHLVFSTLHTNNAAGAIPRLIDLGVSAKILTSALTLPIAQRLVRKLCEFCRGEGVPKPEEQFLIDNVIATIKKKKPDLVIPDTHKIWHPVGCEKCNKTGYKGRVGVFEAVIMDDAVAKVTIENPSEKEIKIAAIPQGILDMRQDGILKILNGITDLAELGRVVDLTGEFI